MEYKSAEYLRNEIQELLNDIDSVFLLEMIISTIKNITGWKKPDTRSGYQLAYWYVSFMDN